MSRDPDIVAIDAPNHVSAAVVVLLVEAERGAAARIASVLAGPSESTCQFEWVTRLSEATERLRHGDVDAVLIGSSPSGYDSGQALDCIRCATCDALILPLTEVGCAMSIARDGAEDGDECRASGSYWEGRWFSDVLHYVGQRKATLTALHETDEILFEAKERAQVTLSSIGDAVLVTDIEGNVTYLNPMAEVLTGWSCGDATDRAFTDVFAIVDGATREPAVNSAQRGPLMQTRL